MKTTTKIKKILKGNLTAFIISFILVATIFATIIIYNNLKTKKLDKEILQKYKTSISLDKEKKDPSIIKKSAEVKSGDNLTGILTGLDVSYDESVKIISSLNGILDIHTLKPKTKRTGDEIFVFFKINPDIELSQQEPNLQKIIIKRSPIEQVVITKNTDNSFHSKKITEKPITKIVVKEGTINADESISLVADRLDIPYAVVITFYDTMSFDIDFERDIYAGDTFKFAYEKQYSSNGEYLGVGRLLYAKLKSRQNIELFRYTSNNKDTFYSKDGQGVAKTLKKTPINKARISSRFSLSRKHPVLGYTRKHKGVDFAAPRGTPIPAGGTGVVTIKKYGRGYGNWIEIKHNSTYRTRYGHMQKFASGIRQGSRVKMGQIIGYVGSTGMSTGPHLHYEVLKNGTQINPLTMKLPPVESLKGQEFKDFKNVRDNIISTMEFLEK